MEPKPLQIQAPANHSTDAAEVASDVSQSAEEFRTMPHDAEDFGTVPQVAERKENHTLTVREAARMFEAAGVARTERSIINWCGANRQGVARLDSYFDPNERKYFITPQSVETAIQEEIQRFKKLKETAPSEPFGTDVEHVKHPTTQGEKAASFSEERKIQELQRQIRDLNITNRSKDLYIERLQTERADFFDKLITTNRKMGEMEADLRRLEPPK